MKTHESSPRLLTILDLDETLIHATQNPSFSKSDSDFLIDEFHVYRRPFLEEFLHRVSQFSDLAIRSSASDAYVAEIVRHIVPEQISLSFVWGRSRCTHRMDAESMLPYWVKDLKKTKRKGYSLERTLIVDDSPEKIERHYGNYISVDPFEGDPNDRILTKLPAYLSQFIEAPNVRSVEKRGWQHPPLT